jgi:hypothetical protein
MESIRLIFIIAALNSCEVVSLDVKGAYLRGTRRSAPGQAEPDEVFLRLPQGLDLLGADPRFRYRDDNGDPLLWRCDANLYGLQDAGAVFYALARDWLLEIGFTQSTVDPCIFVLRRGAPHNDFTVQGLYVDDSLGAYSTTAIKEWFLTEFEKKFEQSPDSGDGHPEFLAMRFKVSADRKTIRVNTPKLWGRLRTRLADVNLPTVSSPTPSNFMDLLFAPEDPVLNPMVSKSEFDMRGILGVVNWGILACRPAEAFAGAAIARRCNKPTASVVKCLIHLSAYCLAHEHDEMIFQATGDDRLVTSVDSSWGNDPETFRSWFGFCLMWCGAVFAFRSKLEPCVALSSRDAEAIAAVFAVRAMISNLILLTELGFHQSLPLPLNVDNKSTVDGAHSAKIHKDSRHQALRLSWLQEIVRNNIVNIRHIATTNNLADVFTKNLSADNHARIRAMLMGHVVCAVLFVAFGT